MAVQGVPFWSISAYFEYISGHLNIKEIEVHAARAAPCQDQISAVIEMLEQTTFIAPEASAEGACIWR